MILPSLGIMLLVAAAVGLGLLVGQLVVLVGHRARQPLGRAFTPSISILKPLCGADDELEENLECFASLAYLGDVEVLLGVRSEEDAATPIARRMVARYPERFRLVFQRGEPGLNPKVNQLITLAAAARHPLLVVSDSNVRVPPGYLFDIAAHLVDPQVGCVSHPVAGVGERTLGSRLDNLHLASSVGAGMVAAKRIADKDLVVGKSMALWQDDLDQLGGFESVKDVLAEDHVLGNRVRSELGKRVIISTLPTFNVSVERSLGSFFRRYLRWGVIHRTAIDPSTYLAEALLNPIPLALMGALLHPTHATGLALGAIVVGKCWVDVLALARLRGGLTWMALPAVLVKDAVLFVCWLNGLFARTVDWRGNRLRVMAGSRLVPLEAPVLGLGEDAPAAAQS